jgi:hypothetical protein
MLKSSGKGTEYTMYGNRGQSDDSRRLEEAIFRVGFNQEGNESQYRSIATGLCRVWVNLEEKLKELPKQTRCAIRHLANSVVEDTKPGNLDENSNRQQHEAFMETTSRIQ